MIDDAAKEDVVVSAVVPPKDGKYNLYTVIALPNEGTYDFLDLEFYPKHPNVRFVEVPRVRQDEQNGNMFSSKSIPISI